MYLVSVITALLAFTAQGVVGFTVPQGQPDGTYQVTILDDGTEQHVRIPGVPSVLRANEVASNALYDPSEYAITCEDDGDELVHQDCDYVSLVIDEQCGKGKSVGVGASVYSIRRCAVAYYCHVHNTQTKASLSCSAAERGATSLYITDKCGYYKSGYAVRAMADSVTGVVQKWIYGREDYCKSNGQFCDKE